MHHLCRLTINLCSLNLCDLISGKKCDLGIIPIQNLNFFYIIGNQWSDSNSNEHEENNRYDRYAVAVKGPCKGILSGVHIIGHVPIEIQDI